MRVLPMNEDKEDETPRFEEVYREEDTREFSGLIKQLTGKGVWWQYLFNELGCLAVLIVVVLVAAVFGYLV